MILYCISTDGKVIERIYIIPKKEIINRKTISIFKKSSRHEPWYEQYRVKSEDVLRQVNKIWKKIIMENNKT